MNTKLENLKNEIEAASKQIEVAVKNYTDAVIEQAVDDVLNELDDVQLLMLIGALTEIENDLTNEIKEIEKIEKKCREQQEEQECLELLRTMKIFDDLMRM